MWHALLLSLQIGMIAAVDTPKFGLSSHLERWPANYRILQQDRDKTELYPCAAFSHSAEK